jgi:sugar phosphate isomerase/epimerase
VSESSRAAGVAGKAVVRGRIKQSIVFWCFNIAGEMWDLDKMCQVTRDLGVDAVEIVAPQDWGILKKYGLKCALSPNGMPGMPFVKGFNNPLYHDEVVARTIEAIDATADAGFPNVIAFTGYKWRNAEDPTSGEISADECLKNCVAGLKKVVGHAEKRGVTLCLEHLNTRDDTHPMKGHPGYQGDDINLVAKIIRQVDSPRLKMLFDIYHVQIMHGDVIRRVEEHKDIIGHVHTAGNPGRAELDDQQEINFPPILRKLLAVGYQGYVGQEFIPTRDPIAGLREAVTLCDV